MVRKIFYVLGAVLALLLVVVVLVVVLVDANDYREEIAERASNTLGREVRLEGPLRLRLVPRLSLDIRDLTVANPAAFADAPALARVGGASVSVAVWPLLRGELEIGQVLLRDATVSLVSGADGSSNLDGLFAEPAGEPQIDSAPDLSRLSLAGLRLENVSLQMLERGADEAVRVRIDELNLGAFRPGQVAPLRIQASLLNAQRESQLGLSVQGGLQVASDLGRIDLEDARAEFEMASGGIAGHGRASVSVKPSGEAPILELRDLAAALNLDGQSLELSAGETLTLRLDDPVSARFEALELAVNGEPLRLSGGFALADPITAEMAVAGRKLDLRPWLSLAEQGAQDESPSSTPGTDFSALVGPRLTFDLTLDELVIADDLVLGQVDGQARLVDGVLTLEPMQAQGFGGRFSGLVSVDFNALPPRVRVHPQLAGVEVQQLVRLLSPVAPLRGLGEMELDLRFAGLSPAEILASLDGEGRFSLNEGALMGVDLQRLIDEEITVSNLSSIQQAFGGETPFRTLTGRIQAEEGVLTLPDLRLEADEFGLTGGGTMDLAAGEIAYQFDLALGQALIERLPGALARASNGVIPLTIAGPIRQPLVRVDLEAIAEGALQRELQDRLFDRLAPQESSETAPDETPQPESESRERTSDLLLRALRDRRQEDEPQPDPP